MDLISQWVRNSKSGWALSKEYILVIEGTAPAIVLERCDSPNLSPLCLHTLLCIVVRAGGERFGESHLCKTMGACCSFYHWYIFFGLLYLCKTRTTMNVTKAVMHSNFYIYLFTIYAVPSPRHLTHHLSSFFFLVAKQWFFRTSQNESMFQKYKF